MLRLKKCPDCGGKMESGKTEFLTESEYGLIAIENIDTDIYVIYSSEYLPAESDNYIEITIEKILTKKITTHREEMFRNASKT